MGTAATQYEMLKELTEQASLQRDEAVARALQDSAASLGGVLAGTCMPYQQGLTAQQYTDVYLNEATTATLSGWNTQSGYYKPHQKEIPKQERKLGKSDYDTAITFYRVNEKVTGFYYSNTFDSSCCWNCKRSN